MRKLMMCATWVGAFAVILGVLSGCASAPAYRYYTIDMQPGAHVDSTARVSDVNIRVNQALSKPEILIRTSPTQVEYYALDRWASGLEEQVAEKLKTEFAGISRELPALALDGTLMAFEQVDTPAGAEVRVKLEIEFNHPAKELRNLGIAPTFKKIYERTEPSAAPTADAAVAALSRAIESIAVEIGKDLSDFVKNLSAN